MTRRQLLQLSGVYLTCTAGCTTGATETLSQVKDMAAREGLVIVGSRLSPIPNAPEGFDVTGKAAGGLAKVDCLYDRSVSPDGDWVAWVPLSSQPHIGHEEPVALFADNALSVHSVRFTGRFGQRAAISSGASHLAVIAVVGEALNRRLIVLNPATAKVEYDLTELVTRFSLNDVFRFQISANGGRLVVGPRESFLVIDVPSRKVVLEGDGRFVSLSPQGDALAFLNKRGDLVVTTLVTGASRMIQNPGWVVEGVGGWSPDGKFLLAGARPLLGFFLHLVAIDCATEKFADLVPRLEEGDRGETSFFIKRRLLSPID